MKSKIMIAILAVVVCLFGFIATRYTEHDNHEHDHLQPYGTSCDNGEYEDEKGHGQEEQAIELTAEEIQEIGLETAVAGSGIIDIHINLTGEISVNQDRMAHIVPRTVGVVTEVRKKLGDVVKTGEIIAVIESRQLADAKAGYLGAVERYEMAKLSFNR